MIEQLTTTQMNKLYAVAKRDALSFEVDNGTLEKVHTFVFADGTWTRFTFSNSRRMVLQNWEPTKTWVQCTYTAVAQYN